MTCEQLDEQLPLYALGALKGAELETVRVHLSTGCPTCSGKVAEANASLALFALSTVDKSTIVPSTAKARLDTLINDESAGIFSEREVGQSEREGLRLTSDAADKSSITLGRIGSSGGSMKLSWLPLAVAACLIAAVTAGMMWIPLNSAKTELAQANTQIASFCGERDTATEKLNTLTAENTKAAEHIAQIKSQLADAEKRASTAVDDLVKLQLNNKQLDEQLTALRSEKSKLDEQLVSAQRELNMLYSQQLVTVDLKGQSASPDAQARLLVDLKEKVWKLYATNMTPLNHGVYEFWLITDDGTPVPMGSFSVDKDGRGTLSDKVPDPLPKLAKAAISNEPAPGAKVPTGKLHVVGEFH